MEAGIITKLFGIVYRRRKPTELSSEKPRVSFFPRYQFEALIANSVLNSDDPHGSLEKLLQSQGFQLEKWTREKVYFTRGKDWGDFSIKISKVSVEFALPLAPQSAVVIGYGKFALFDTGDLWEAANRIKSELANSMESEAEDSDE
jgi:hypothetical protein